MPASPFAARSAAGLLAVALGILVSATPAAAIPITGRVLGPDGKPVAGAQVASSAVKDSGLPAALTDAAGAFTFEVEPSPASPDFWGYVTAYIPGLGLGGKLLAKTGPNDIHLRTAVAVAGIVQTPEGRPVADAVVRVGHLQQVDPAVSVGRSFIPMPAALAPNFTTKSGADGRWTIAGLPVHSTATFVLDVRPYIHTFAQVEIGSVAATTTLVAQPEAVITGKVVREGGEPAAGIEVKAATEDRFSPSSQATTAGDGTYRIEGLPSGKYLLSASDPEKKWVALQLEEVPAQEGATRVAPDIVLSAGALIEGTVTDAATGAPLRGMSISCFNQQHPRPALQGYAATDTSGRYTVRVAPGKTVVHVAAAFGPYLFEAGDKTYRAELEVAKGDTKTVDFQLRKGLTVAATVVDETLRPVADLAVSLEKQSTKDSPRLASVDVRTDATGKLLAQGLVPGTWRLNVGDDWRVLEPAVLQLPAAGELRIKLRRHARASFKARVVDTAGRPIADATVQPRIVVTTQTAEDNFYAVPGQEQQVPLTTDAAGQVVISNIRTGSKVSLVVSKPGFAYASGGKVSEQAGVFSSTDVVLAPLTARLEGIMAGAVNVPADGATVFCPEGGPEALATTDAAGKFVLPALPEGVVTLVAVAGHSSAMTTAKTGGGVAFALRPRKPLPEHDVWRANEIFTRAKVDALGREEETGGYDSRMMASMLAPLAPDMALQIGTDFSGNLPDDVRWIVIDRLARANPARAAVWAPDQLAAIKDTSQRLYATLSLAYSVAGTDPDLATSLHRQVVKLAAALPAPETPLEPMQLNLSLWKVAHRLNLPEAARYRAAIATTLEQQQEAKVLRGLAANVAEVDAALAEQILARVPEALRVGSYPRVIAALAGHDLQAARRLLEQIAQSKDERVAASFGFAAMSVIRELGKTDPAATLALARRVHGQPRLAALVRAAQFQPKEGALAVLDEVAAIVMAEPYATSSYTPARVAALVYQLDGAAGAKLFAKARAKLSQNTQRSGELATFAFYYSRFDPAGSRILLEQEFARQKPIALQTGDTAELLGLIGAMGAVDVDRALQWFQQLPPAPASDEGPKTFWYRSSTLTRLARYVLATEARRAVQDFAPVQQGHPFDGDWDE